MSVADGGGGWFQGNHASLGAVKTSHKNMAAKDGGIDFMFLAPRPPPGRSIRYCLHIRFRIV